MRRLITTVSTEDYSDNISFYTDLMTVIINVNIIPITADEITQILLGGDMILTIFDGDAGDNAKIQHSGRWH